mmetsp:Transcript_2949/g.6380  ORF Transcript_2949/g.6380 Transcript_2949/m.6380 type:complete len:92 (+) Transcript_2949:450-725(+)
MPRQSDSEATPFPTAGQINDVTTLTPTTVKSSEGANTASTAPLSPVTSGFNVTTLASTVQVDNGTTVTLSPIVQRPGQSDYSRSYCQGSGR